MHHVKSVRVISNNFAHIEVQCQKLSAGGTLWTCRRRSEGVGADLISQLASDAVAMLVGKLLPTENREARHDLKCISVQSILQ